MFLYFEIYKKWNLSITISRMLSSNLWLFDRAEFVKINFYNYFLFKIFPFFDVFTSNFPENSNN